MKIVYETKILQEIIEKLNEYEIETKIDKVSNQLQSNSSYYEESDRDLFCVVVEGFKKSGTVLLVEKENKVYAIQRYGEVEQLESFDDLVSLNFYWYNDGISRGYGEAPSENWEKPLIEYGFLEVRTFTQKKYKKKR